MNKIIKASIGCIAALLFVTSCGAETAVQTVESVEQPVIERTESYDAVAEVVLHEYEPTNNHNKTSSYSGSFEYTHWTPVTIIECNGMTKRFEDQATYEHYYMHEKLTATVTDGIDGDGNVVSCDFVIGERIKEESE